MKTFGHMAVLPLMLTVWMAGAAERPIVFVSISPQAWLVKHVAGDAVEVHTLLPPGASPHTFEVRAPQVKQLAAASLYLTVGMPFETRLADRAAKLNSALRVTGMDAGIVKFRDAHEHGHADAHDDDDCCGEGGDPHIWLSPRLFAAMASNTAVALTGLLPGQKSEFAANLKRTVDETAATDRAVRRMLLALPVKTWVAYHPSWRYFAAEYGLTLLSIEADGKTPPARHLAEVMGQARAAGVRVVFAEPQFDKRLAQAVADRIGARLVSVDPLREDWPAMLRAAAAALEPDKSAAEAR